jgi:hypothetical protein
VPNGAGDEDAGEVAGKVFDDESGCKGVEGPLTTVAPALVDVGTGVDALLAGVPVAEGFVPLAAPDPLAAVGELAAFGAGEFPGGAAAEDGLPCAEFPGELGPPEVVLAELPVPDVAPCAGVAGFVFFSSEGL